MKVYPFAYFALCLAAIAFSWNLIASRSNTSSSRFVARSSRNELRSPVQSHLLSLEKLEVVKQLSTQRRVGPRACGDEYENLEPKQVQVYLSYYPRGGCCNQLWGHINALALAQAMNVVLVLPPSAWSRENYSGWARYKEEPLNSLINTSVSIENWKNQGIFVLQDPSEALSGCTEIDLVNHTIHSRITKIHTQTLDRATCTLWNIVEQEQINPHAKCVNINLGNPFLFLFDGRRHWALDPGRTPAAKSLVFNSAVLSLAENILTTIHTQCKSDFDGVHLRVEGDWRFFKGAGATSIFNTSDPILVYINKMQPPLFSARCIYVASGIFLDKTNHEILEIERKFTISGRYSKFLYKEALVQPEVLQGFHSEQLALADLLVLSHAKAAVGEKTSSFSCFLQEQRAFIGKQAKTFVYVVD